MCIRQLVSQYNADSPKPSRLERFNRALVVAYAAVTTFTIFPVVTLSLVYFQDSHAILIQKYENFDVDTPIG